MINYARHDEEFHGIFKLVSGEEILAKAVLTEDNGESLVFIQDPVCIQAITKEVDDTKMVRGMGFSKWMSLSEEDFFILREKDILLVSSMSPAVVLLYESYVLGEEGTEEKKQKNKTTLKNTEGYLGDIEEARKRFKKLYES